jgi:GMP synthase-like glutamine amidotransferase
MKVAVIETGTTRDALRAAHGNYPDMLIGLVASEMPEATFSAVSVVNGDPVPAVGDFDGFVIMGSRHSVHDALPWIEPLKALVRDCAAARIPQVGICFGHQLIAEALGGQVVHSESGWIAGVQQYQVVDPESAALLGDVTSIAYHQEQVAGIPPGAATVLTTDTCPYAGLLYAQQQAFSVQCHPEFDVPYAKGLIEVTSGDPLNPEFAKRAIETLQTTPDRRRMALAIASALHGGDGSAITRHLAGN